MINSKIWKKKNHSLSNNLTIYAMSRFEQRIKVKVCFFIALHINKQKNKKEL